MPGQWIRFWAAGLICGWTLWASLKAERAFGGLKAESGQFPGKEGLQAFLPMGHGGKAAVLHAHAHKAGICGTLRWRHVLCACAGLDVLLDPGKGKDFPGKAVPGGLPLAGQVESAHQVGIAQDFRYGPGHGKRACGATRLVVDNAYARPAFFCQAQHGVHKAWAARAVEPGDAGNDMVRAVETYGPFSRPLALAVDIDAACRPGKFGVGPAFPVKDVVCGKGYEAHVALLAGHGDIGRALHVHFLGKGRVAFALIDLCVGRAVQDNLGLE